MTALARMAEFNRCGCPHFHDQSAGCKAVADALRRNRRREHLMALLCRRLPA